MANHDNIQGSNTNARYLAPVALVVSALAFVYAPVVASLVRQWASDDNYSQGFIVAPFALLAVWRARAALRALPARPHPAGLAIVVLGVFLLMLGQFGAELFLTRVSLLVVITGTVLYLWGAAHVRRVAFALVLVLLVIPLPSLILNRVSFPLQLMASRTAEAALSTAGVPVLRDGNVLMLPHGALEVAQACSGIRSLSSLIALALMISGPGKRALFAVLAVPVAVIANAVRVAGTGFAAVWLGQWAAEGFFHTFSGWLMFVVALAALIGCAHAIQWMSTRTSWWVAPRSLPS
jgi:exosortase